jgi:DNA-directed RNA polymerase specialized sigma54-like protein
MAFLEHKLNLKVQQKQLLTPSLVQMVNLLQLNKLELTDMIQQELVQNPVLEELCQARLDDRRLSGTNQRRLVGVRVNADHGVAIARKTRCGD